MTESLEDYLESIYFLYHQNNQVRVTDISERLKVKKPSVVNAVKQLSQLGLVSKEKYGKVMLTEKGEVQASVIMNKHKLIFRFLTEVLKVNEKNADEEACHIEHVVSDETLTQMKKMLAENITVSGIEIKS